MAAKKRIDWKSKALKLEREQAEIERKNINLQRQVDAQAKEEKKRWSLIIFCTNCLVVSTCSAPPEVTITNLDCLNCRVRGSCHLVREVHA